MLQKQSPETGKPGASRRAFLFRMARPSKRRAFPEENQAGWPSGSKAGRLVSIKSAMQAAAMPVMPEMRKAVA